jgi:peptidoglycan LD-endopeptidase LytH
MHNWFSRIVCTSAFLPILFFTFPQSASAVYGEDLFWPTPNLSFLENLPPETYLQATGSGRVESGNWGCSRNNGTKFHEGVDLKSIRRNLMGSTNDRVFCAADGVVAHVNNNVADSNYGRYIVISHNDNGLEWYSLYAHLNSIDKFVRPSKRVTGGEAIGIIGNTSSSITIPKNQSHLHFEIGLRASSSFDQWYLSQHYDSPNKHASWNGINLLGTDPLKFYRYFLDHPEAHFYNYFLEEPISFELLVYFSRFPDFLNRNPVFLTNQPISEQGGWFSVGFTWYGLPTDWTSIPKNGVDIRFQKDQIYIRSSKHERSCRKWVDDSKGVLLPTPLLLKHLAILKAGD